MALLKPSSSSSDAITDKYTLDLSTFLHSSKAPQYDRDELPELRGIGGELDVPLRPVERKIGLKKDWVS